MNLATFITLSVECQITELQGMVVEGNIPTIDEDLFAHLVGTLVGVVPSEMVSQVVQVIRIMCRSKAIIMQSSAEQLIVNILNLLDVCVYGINLISSKNNPLEHVLLLVDCTSILKRVTFQRQDVVHVVCQQQSLQRIINLITVPHHKLIAVSLDFVDFLHDHLPQPQQQLLVRELHQLFYIGKLLHIIERSDDGIKRVAVNLITKLLECEKFQDNFSTVQGGSTILSELAKAQQLDTRIPLLNCLLKMVLKADNLFDMKVCGVVPTLQRQLECRQSYMVTVTSINILCYLALDEDLALKMMERDSFGGEVVVRQPRRQQGAQLALPGCECQGSRRGHPRIMYAHHTNTTEIYCFKLLRFLYSNQRIRALVKRLFTPRLLQIFIDVGNYVRSLTNYKPIMVAFNRMNTDDLKAMEACFTHHEQHAEVVDNLQLKMAQYTLLKVVGKGAFGEVYLCQLGENRYALKKLMGDAKIHTEVEIHKTLLHPNITRYYECFESDGNLCLVLEYVDGVNLSEFINSYSEKGHKIPESVIWKVLIHLSTALKLFIGVLFKTTSIKITRDLNPANIMITTHHDIKLCDFGLARHITDHSDNMLNSFVGTLIYACPEIIENQPYNEKADVWALGCIAYELLTLRSPFASNNPLLLAKRIVQVQYEEITSTHYSRELIDFVSRCLVKNPLERPSIVQLLTKLTTKLVECLTSTQISQGLMSDEMESLRHQLRSRPEQRKMKLQVSKLKEVDPVSQLLSTIQRILRVCNSMVLDKDIHKRQAVDQFYHRIILQEDVDTLKHMKKLFTLSKEDIPGVWLKQQEGGAQNAITYEQLYFLMQDL